VSLHLYLLHSFLFELEADFLGFHFHASDFNLLDNRVLLVGSNQPGTGAATKLPGYISSSYVLYRTLESNHTSIM
jgi:hypothetical protein